MPPEMAKVEHKDPAAIVLPGRGACRAYRPDLPVKAVRIGIGAGLTAAPDGAPTVQARQAACPADERQGPMAPRRRPRERKGGGEATGPAAERAADARFY